uniref:C2H2-type domain-containing protein n=1 Tax=Macrostomum lignano TaxID=282301 RepID=A0A1I8IPN4_9PLAT
MLTAPQQQRQQGVPILSPLLFPSPTLPTTTSTSAAAPASSSSVGVHHQLADHLPRVDASPEPPGVPGCSDSQHSASGAVDDPSGGRGGRQPVTTCHQCGRGFVCQGDMNAHFELEHLAALMGEFDHGKSWKSSAVENKELNVEATMVRLENGDTIGFKCPECDYFAKWPTELQKHIMVHSSARPHVCVVCGCTYKWKWDLGRHFDRSHESAAMPNPYKKNSARPSSGGGGGYPSSASAAATSSTGRSTPRAPRQSGGSGSSRLASPSAGGSTTAELLAYYSTPARSAAMAAAAASAAAAAAAAAVGEAAVSAAASPSEPRELSPPPPRLVLKSEDEDGVNNDSQLQQQLACPICGAQTRWPDELKTHVVGHSEFRPYRCSGCPFASRERSEVVAHIEASCCEPAGAGHHPADSTVLCEPPPLLVGVFADGAEVADYAERAARWQRLQQFDGDDEEDEAATAGEAEEANDDSRDEDAKATSLLKSEPGSPAEAPSSSVREPPEMPRVGSPTVAKRLDAPRSCDSSSSNSGSGGSKELANQF